jgi:integrase
MRKPTLSSEVARPTNTLPAPLIERMAEQARASRAETTWSAYASDWRVWEAWAGQIGAATLPAEAEAVAAFLSDMSRTRKLSTLRRYLASISVAHQAKGLGFETGAPPIKAIMRGAARQKVGDRRKVKALMPRHALAKIDAAASGRLVDLRDAAVLALGIAMAGRRSEVAGLDWLVRGSGKGALELVEAGATVKLYRSKTAQDRVDEVAINDGPALATVRHWVGRAGIAPGSPLFRAVTPRGRVSPTRIADRTIARIVKRAADSVGLDPAEFSGHSMRAGLITAAVERGSPEWKVRLTSRHSARSRELEQYIRPLEKRRFALTSDVEL